jgi:hypothetical protein
LELSLILSKQVTPEQTRLAFDSSRLILAVRDGIQTRERTSEISPFKWIAGAVGILLVTGLLFELDPAPPPAVIRCIDIGYQTNSATGNYGPQVTLKNLTDQPLTISYLGVMALSNSIASQWQNTCVPQFGMKPHEIVNLTIPVTNHLMPPGQWWISGQAWRPLHGVASLIDRFRYAISARKVTIQTAAGITNVFNKNLPWYDDTFITSAWFTSTNIGETEQDY